MFGHKKKPETTTIQLQQELPLGVERIHGESLYTKLGSKGLLRIPGFFKYQGYKKVTKIVKENELGLYHDKTVGPIFLAPGEYDFEPPAREFKETVSIFDKCITVESGHHSMQVVTIDDHELGLIEKTSTSKTIQHILKPGTYILRSNQNFVKSADINSAYLELGNHKQIRVRANYVAIATLDGKQVLFNGNKMDAPYVTEDPKFSFDESEGFIPVNSPENVILLLSKIDVRLANEFLADYKTTNECQALFAKHINEMSTMEMICYAFIREDAYRVPELTERLNEFVNSKDYTKNRLELDEHTRQHIEIIHSILQLHDLHTHTIGSNEHETKLITSLSSLLRFRACRFVNLDLLNAPGIDLNMVHLSNSKLQDVQLPAANLSKGQFQRSDLSRAGLSKADLSEACLWEANLSDADLSEANLSDADLNGANLNGANLRGANLRNADLSNTDLTNADLTGADLTGANVTGAILAGIILQDAQMEGVKTKVSDIEYVSEEDFNGILFLSGDDVDTELTAYLDGLVQRKMNDHPQAHEMRQLLVGKIKLLVDRLGVEDVQTKVIDAALSHSVFEHRQARWLKDKINSSCRLFSKEPMIHTDGQKALLTLKERIAIPLVDRAELSQ